MSARRLLIWLAAILLVFATGWWALSVLVNPIPAAEPVEAVTVELQNGSVERVEQYVATISWKKGVAPLNRSVGTLTGLGDEAVRQVAVGDVLYHVDELPIIAAVGSVPMYRDIGAGMRGSDVRQAQVMLNSLGYTAGQEDGVVGGQFSAATREWQRDLGLPITGSVSVGSVQFLPTLPSAFIASDATPIGSVLSGGEQILWPLAQEPEVSVVVPPGDIAAVSSGMSVTLELDGDVLSGTIDQPVTDEAGNTRFGVDVEGGTALCANECVSADSELTRGAIAFVTVVEPTSGLTLPISAIRSGVDGKVAVLLDDERLIEVEVLAVASALAVIDGAGLEQGQRAVISAGTESS